MLRILQQTKELKVEKKPMKNLELIEKLISRMKFSTMFHISSIIKKIIVQKSIIKHKNIVRYSKSEILK